MNQQLAVFAIAKYHPHHLLPRHLAVRRGFSAHSLSQSIRKSFFRFWSSRMWLLPCPVPHRMLMRLNPLSGSAQVAQCSQQCVFGREVHHGPRTVLPS
jgi:hypothetical protein